MYLFLTILRNFKEIYKIYSFSFSYFASGISGERHLFTSCDGCQRKPIIGFRWHCKEGSDYDLCTQCYLSDCPHNGRTFERIDNSESIG